MNFLSKVHHFMIRVLGKSPISFTPIIHILKIYDIHLMKRITCSQDHGLIEKEVFITMQK